MLTALANQFRLHKLDKVEKFVMSYGGLRGAVAFALVLLIDPKHVSLQPMFVTTTIAVIYFTVFIQVSLRRTFDRSIVLQKSIANCRCISDARVFLHEVQNIDFARINRMDPVSGASSTEQMTRAYFETRPNGSTRAYRFLSDERLFYFRSGERKEKKKRDRGSAAKSIVRLIDD